MTEAIYTVRGLSKSYGERRVLRDLSFDIYRGECFVIMGRSGCGKSVTLRQLNGLEHPDSGSILFDGTDISELEERELYPLRRRVAMLFQGGALFDSMNAFDNVAFPLREHTELSAEEIAAQVREKLSMVRLGGVEDRMPAALSGGMKKRLALARSLALDPEVVLFDEPTTGLDPMTAATISHMILDIQDKLGVTPVVVTHDLQLAKKVGNRVAFLHRGDFRFLGGWGEAEASQDPRLIDFLEGREEEEEDAA
jgi:phospholipid/cholesterol/gamma-HCH transport system ATP-binding protein